MKPLSQLLQRREVPVRSACVARQAARHRLMAAATAAVGLILTATVQAHDASMSHKPPPPGGYRLEHIMPVPGGTVLDVDGRSRALSDFTSGKVTLLSFIYTSCKDPTGCPLAYQVMVDLKRAITADPGLAGKVRFVTLSFDFQKDTPARMKLYGGSHLRETEALEWYFLTTKSRAALLPILTQFNQDLSPAADPALGPYSHVLKVFLIDPEGWVREIYGTSFLQPDTMLNDMRNLLREEQQAHH